MVESSSFGPKDEYGNWNRQAKIEMRKFIPKKDFCQDTKMVGTTGQWNFKGKQYNVLSEKERPKKLKRSEYCYSKRKWGVSVTASLIICITGLIIMLASYFSAWQNFSEIYVYWQLGSFLLVGGLCLFIITYLFWKSDHNAIVSLEK